MSSFRSPLAISCGSTSAAPERLSLRETLRASPRLAERRLWGAEASVALADIAHGTALGGALPALAGRSVLLRTRDPLAAALALIELDGVARRIVLCPPDLSEAALQGVIETAAVDALASDEAPSEITAGLGLARIALPLKSLIETPDPAFDTEWVMFTSGTSGPPKMVVHTLGGLSGAIRPADPSAPPPVWGTFYDIRRYGGLQILLRGLLGEGSLAITAPSEPMADFLVRLGRLGVTHVTGTPSHWRSVLMRPEAAAIHPAYVRLSGEIADQSVLDALKVRYAGVPVGHAYASTEAGVGFEVTDGLEGFPASFVGRPGDVEMRVADGVLQLRSSRTSGGYLNPDAAPLFDADGFVDTGDMVELRGERYHFVGRRGGVINVGGLKVHPEEIEAVINSHPAVRMSLVRGRRNPFTGAIAVAEVVLNDGAPDETALKSEILEICRRELAPFKVPASLKFAASLAMTAGGKLERALA
ncbi:MAG TPA: fatty acid--CoA ligase family protein [Caulobacteraceae bacterium]|nr:fatty acid--CoA ligase family protein [Caulobacteraceae bacterium]